MPIYIVEYQDPETEIFEYKIFEGPKIEDWKQFIKDLIPSAQLLSKVGKGNSYPSWDVYENTLPRILAEKGFIEVTVQSALFVEGGKDKAFSQPVAAFPKGDGAVDKIIKTVTQPSKNLWGICDECHFFPCKCKIPSDFKPEMQYVEIEVKRNGNRNDANGTSGKKGSSKKR